MFSSGAIVSWCPGSEQSRASGQAARRARSGQASPSSVCDLAEQIDQRLIRFPGLRRKARNDVAEVGSVERRLLVDLSREETLAKRAEGNEADPEFLERRQHSSSGRLHHSEYSLWTAVTGWTAWARRIVFTPGFGKAEVLDLTFPNQVLHRSRHVFDRHLRVDTVLVEQIDGIDPEPLERALGDSA